MGPGQVGGVDWPRVLTKAWPPGRLWAQGAGGWEGMSRAGAPQPRALCPQPSWVPRPKPLPTQEGPGVGAAGPGSAPGRVLTLRRAGPGITPFQDPHV